MADGKSKDDAAEASEAQESRLKPSEPKVVEEVWIDHDPIVLSVRELEGLAKALTTAARKNPHGADVTLKFAHLENPPNPPMWSNNIESTFYTAQVNWDGSIDVIKEENGRDPDDLDYSFLDDEIALIREKVITAEREFTVGIDDARFDLDAGIYSFRTKGYGDTQLDPDDYPVITDALEKYERKGVLEYINKQLLT